MYLSRALLHPSLASSLPSRPVEYVLCSLADLSFFLRAAFASSSFPDLRQNRPPAAHLQRLCGSAEALWAELQLAAGNYHWLRRQAIVAAYLRLCRQHLLKNGVRPALKLALGSTSCKELKWDFEPYQLIG